MAQQAADQCLVAEQYSGLRAAEELVAARRNQGGALAQRDGEVGADSAAAAETGSLFSVCSWLFPSIYFKVFLSSTSRFKC